MLRLDGACLVNQKVIVGAQVESLRVDWNASHGDGDRGVRSVDNGDGQVGRGVESNILANDWRERGDCKIGN